MRWYGDTSSWRRRQRRIRQPVFPPSMSLKCWTQVLDPSVGPKCWTPDLNVDRRIFFSQVLNVPVEAGLRLYVHKKVTKR